MRNSAVRTSGDAARGDRLPALQVACGRPRVLRQLGFRAAAFLQARLWRTCASITGYSREAFDGMPVAFGDDVAAAGHPLDVSTAGVAGEVSAPASGSNYPHRPHRDPESSWWVSRAGDRAVRC